MSWPWSELGLSGPADLDTVKHAYAQCLKTTHPEDDPEGFQRLHSAYQAARRMARVRRTDTVWPEEPQEENPEEGSFGYNQQLDQRDEAPDPPESEDGGFDFEKLFEEGNAEREIILRRRVEERLRAARDRRENDTKFKRDAALDSKEAWNAAYDALHAVEILCNAGASSEEWSLFLHSGTFLNAQHNMDFIFGLEDFLKERTWLPDDIKRKIFLTYHFYRGKPSAIYLGLYHLLLDSYRSAGKANKGIRRSLWTGRRDYFLVVMIMLVFVLMTSLPLLERGSDLDSSAPDTGSTGANSGILPKGGSGEDVTDFHGLVISYAVNDFPGPYAITGSGTAENELGTFDWMQCKGQDASGEDLIMNYYLSGDGKSLYCIPDSKSGETVEMECTHTWRGVSVYRCVDGS